MRASCKGPRVGLRAPALRIRSKGHAPVTLEALEGRPVVLSFLGSFPDGAGSTTIDALRAELRGLGAVLVCLSNSGLWSFRPDDEMELFARRRDIDDDDWDAAHRTYDVPIRGGSAMFVVDAERKVRFAHVAGLGEEATARTLGDALSSAGRALSTRRPVSLTLTRRDAIVTSLVAGFALALVDGCGGSSPPRTHPPGPSPSPPPPPGPPGEVDVSLDVNGMGHRLHVDPRVSLLDALREHLGMTGTKKGCDHGQCGACTVLVDGRRVNACLTLAVMAEGSKVTTIEGLARGDQLHPMQAAFVAEDGMQCGYCTPGQIMSAVGLLSEGQAKTEADIRELMSGNICRCGAYPSIVAAIQRAGRST